MKKIVGISVMIAFAGSVVFYSCKKDNASNSDTLTADESTMVQDDADVNSSLDDAMAEVDDIGMGATLQSAEMASCKSARLVTKIVDWPRKVTIDFGTGCSGKTGRSKSGTINVTIDGPKPFRFWYPGTSRTITFVDFRVNNRRIEGTKTVTFKGLNDLGQPYWEVKLENGKVTFKDSTSITRSFVHIRTMTAGYDTTSKSIDGEFKIEGYGSGINRKGLKYNDTITTPLVLSQNCKHIKTGEVRITIEGKDPITLTYDNANCSGKAIINKKGKTKEIDLD
jgi:hypothetical protein